MSLLSATARWLFALANRAASAAQRLGAPTLIGVPVSAAILTRVVAVRPEQPLEEAAQLLVTGRHEVLPIVDRGKPVGAISRADIAAGLARGGPRAPVADAPSRHVVAVAPGDALSHVLERLHADPGAIAVVVDHGGPVGLVTEEGLTAYLAATAPALLGRGEP